MSTLASIQRYLRHTGMAPTRFGRCAINDPRLVEDLRRGRELRPATAARIAAYIAAQHAQEHAAPTP